MPVLTLVCVLLAMGCGGTSKPSSRTVSSTQTVNVSGTLPTTPGAYVALLKQFHAQEQLSIRSPHNPAIEALINQTNVAAPKAGLSAVYGVDARTSRLSRCELRTFNTLTDGPDPVGLDRLIVDLGRRYQPAVAVIDAIAAHCRAGTPIKLG